MENVFLIKENISLRNKMNEIEKNNHDLIKKSVATEQQLGYK
jgi:hypothetical protein